MSYFDKVNVSNLLNPHPVAIAGGTVAVAGDVRIVDSSKYVKLDTYNRLPVMDIMHHKIHEGEAFFSNHLFSGVANGATVYILVHCNGDKTVHMLPRVKADGTFSVNMYESPVISASGTSVNVYNYNRIYLLSTSTLVYHTPGITGTGTLIGTEYALGSITHAETGVENQRLERLLVPGSWYLIGVTNNSGSASDVAVSLSWYEVAYALASSSSSSSSSLGFSSSSSTLNKSTSSGGVTTTSLSSYSSIASTTSISSLSSASSASSLSSGTSQSSASSPSSASSASTTSRSSFTSVSSLSSLSSSSSKSSSSTVNKSTSTAGRSTSSKSSSSSSTQGKSTSSKSSSTVNKSTSSASSTSLSSPSSSSTYLMSTSSVIMPSSSSSSSTLLFSTSSDSSSGGETAYAILLEDGDALLTENGIELILEMAS